MIGFDPNKIGASLKCESCGRIIGIFGEGSDIVVLTDYRYCFLEHVATLRDCEGKNQTFTINRLSEIAENLSPSVPTSPCLSLMNVSDTNLSLDEEKESEGLAIPLEENQNGVIDLSSKRSESGTVGSIVSSKKKEILKKVYKKETPKRNAENELYQDAKRGRNQNRRSARAKLEFVDVNHVPLRALQNMVENKEFFDLAVPLHGEKIKRFGY